MAEETTVPMAGAGEASVSRNNMKGSPAGTIPTAPVDYEKLITDLAKKVKSDIPLGMAAADATLLGREIEQRYLPPEPAPSVLEQLEAMKNPPPAEPPPETPTP